MANKVSIWIKNSKGNMFELSNSRCSIMMAKDYCLNWTATLPGTKIGDYDIIINYFDEPGFGGQYALVEHCSNKDIANKIIAVSKKMLKAQYERMMEIRVAQKYKLNEAILSKIQLEYHSSENYELSIINLIGKNHEL